jgi:hypothetical protein
VRGSFEEKVKKAADLGYAGIKLMVRDPANLDWAWVKQTLDSSGLEVPQVVTGELFGADGLCLGTRVMYPLSCCHCQMPISLRKNWMDVYSPVRDHLLLGRLIAWIGPPLRLPSAPAGGLRRLECLIFLENPDL